MKKPLEKINSKYSVDTETLEFYGLRINETLVMTIPKTLSVTFSDKFNIAREELIKKATGNWAYEVSEQLKSKGSPSQ